MQDRKPYNDQKKDPEHSPKEMLGKGHNTLHRFLTSLLYHPDLGLLRRGPSLVQRCLIYQSD
jgi:hypothetical protein